MGDTIVRYGQYGTNEYRRNYMAEFRKRRYLNRGASLKINAIGTRRRLFALQVMGWSFTDLGAKLGVTNSALGSLCHKRPTVYRTTHEKIKALYNELSMIEAPTYSEFVDIRKRAAKRGYVGPLAWDDEMIDDPHAIPMGLTHSQAFTWFWECATMTERIEYVLEHGLDVTRRQPKEKDRSYRKR